jgi:hypothetical protein
MREIIMVGLVVRKTVKASLVRREIVKFGPKEDY